MSPQYGHMIWSADRLIWQVSIDHNMMSYIKKVHGKPRLHVSANLFSLPRLSERRRRLNFRLPTYYLEYGRHLARLHRRRRAYAPTSNAASHDNHEKINSWVSFCYLYGYGAPLGGPSGRRSTAVNIYLII